MRFQSRGHKRDRLSRHSKSVAKSTVCSDDEKSQFEKTKLKKYWEILSKCQSLIVFNITATMNAFFSCKGL
jgi:hypothetical protein